MHMPLHGQERRFVKRTLAWVSGSQRQFLLARCSFTLVQQTCAEVSDCLPRSYYYRVGDGVTFSQIYNFTCVAAKGVCAALIQTAQSLCSTCSLTLKMKIACMHVHAIKLNLVSPDASPTSGNRHQQW